MKKIIIIMLLAMFTMVQADADTQFETRGDTTIIIDGQDTVRFMGVNALTQKITGLLNDTLVNLNEDGSEAQYETENPLQSGENIADTVASTAESISESFFLAVVFIVALSLLFYYLHRRRKYKMVEKAIENNYQLPGYIFGVHQEPARPAYTQAPTPPPFNADGIAAQQPAQADAPQSARPGYQVPPMPVPDRINWSQMKDGLTLVAVGIGLMLFFFVVGATRLACIFIILILIGAGRIWVNYKDQQNAIEWARRQQTWYGTQQPTWQGTQPPMQPQQPAQPQQPPTL